MHNNHITTILRVLASHQKTLCLTSRGRGKYSLHLLPELFLTSYRQISSACKTLPFLRKHSSLLRENNVTYFLRTGLAKGHSWPWNADHLPLHVTHSFQSYAGEGTLQLIQSLLKERVGESTNETDILVLFLWFSIWCWSSCLHSPSYTVFWKSKRV